jgi:hypothetical protein
MRIGFQGEGGSIYTREFLDGLNRAVPLVVSCPDWHYVPEFRSIHDTATVPGQHGHYSYQAVSGSDRVFSVVFSVAHQVRPI